MQTATATVTNIAAYRFARLENLRTLRDHLLAFCKERGLRGTILLSPEGINLFVAGEREHADALLSEIRTIPGLEGLTAKYSESAEQPFRRMLVRLKKEIIAFGVEGIEPGRYTSPEISPAELKQWLDEGRPVTLLDTRNDYEVKLGTFRGALPAGIDNFREFPDAVRRLPEELKDQPIVMFCTGGIRCEKAGPFMEREGFRHIRQLAGGILKYFEECGSAHYDGECFVFDGRTGVDPALSETETVQCYACQEPLTAEEQQSQKYVPGKTCPHCWKEPAEVHTARMQARQQRLRDLAHPLPGSLPYDNFRPLRVPDWCDGMTALDYLCARMPHVPREEWQAICAAGRLLNADKLPVQPADIVRDGQKLIHLVPGTIEPDVNADIRLLHEDDAILVVHKPAPLPMHPGGRFNRNTLQHLLQAACHPEKPHPAHRLDANTSGVVVFSRTRRVASRLQPLFSAGAVEKVYLVRVQGHPAADQFICDAPISAEPGTLGTRQIAPAGLPSLTEFTVRTRLPDGTTLLKARPRTGRTNQIRLHCRHLALPVLGDPTYGESETDPTTQTLPVDAPPLCLHSWRIAFPHPVSSERVCYEAPVPAWAE